MQLALIHMSLTYLHMPRIVPAPAVCAALHLQCAQISHQCGVHPDLFRSLATHLLSSHGNTPPLKRRIAVTTITQYSLFQHGCDGAHKYEEKFHLSEWQADTTSSCPTRKMLLYTIRWSHKEQNNNFPIGTKRMHKMWENCTVTPPKRRPAETMSGDGQQKI
jgi:hypothetical protein